MMGGAEKQKGGSGAGFSSSSQWAGKREGMVYKTGASGVGYYRDEPPEVTWAGGGAGRGWMNWAAVLAIAGLMFAGFLGMKRRALEGDEL